MGKIKYDYVKGFCRPSGYLCLMPVAYEKMETGEYRKKEMVCSLVLSDRCSQQRSCPHFTNASEIHPAPEMLKEKLL